jgi:hypothetical protein
MAGGEEARKAAANLHIIFLHQDKRLGLLHKVQALEELVAQWY